MTFKDALDYGQAILSILAPIILCVWGLAAFINKGAENIKNAMTGEVKKVTDEVTKVTDEVTKVTTAVIELTMISRVAAKTTEIIERTLLEFRGYHGEHFTDIHSLKERLSILETKHTERCNEDCNHTEE